MLALLLAGGALLAASADAEPGDSGDALCLMSTSHFLSRESAGAGSARREKKRMKAVPTEQFCAVRSRLHTIYCDASFSLQTYEKRQGEHSE